MPAFTGFIDDTSRLAHHALLAFIKTQAEATGWWETLRWTDAPDNPEWIAVGKGYSGADPVFVGIRAYQNPDADWYNLEFAAMAGFVSGSGWRAQPAFMSSGVPCHNRRIDYWIHISPQRIAGALKVGTPVYESFYLGKFFPYARPSAYPYPVIVGGMLSGAAATRYSDTAHSLYVKGNRANLKMRFNDGTWKQPEAYPWNNAAISGALRDTGGHTPLLPVELSDANGVYGVLEGIFYISGFDNIVENTLTLDGKDYIVIQDVARTGHGDYYALEL